MLISAAHLMKTRLVVVTMFAAAACAGPAKEDAKGQVDESAPPSTPSSRQHPHEQITVQRHGAASLGSARSLGKEAGEQPDHRPCPV